jgi:hypothetical protein
LLALTSTARLQAITLAVHLQDVDVVREAVEERAGEPFRTQHGVLPQRLTV